MIKRFDPFVVLAPGDTIQVVTAILLGDGKTVTVTTQEAMQNLPYDLWVAGVEDLSGNRIASPVSAGFMGTDASDTTPPQIVLRTPPPGATDVGIGESVVVQFDEPMDYNSVQNALLWNWSSGIVGWQLQEEDDNRFVFSPTQPLFNHTTYVVTLDGSAQDLAGNGLSSGTANWTFTMTAEADQTPPVLVASDPSDGAVNVPVTTNVSLTFSEAIDPLASLEDVSFAPDPGEGKIQWSNGGRTVTFDPDVDLQDDTHYAFLVFPGGVRDVAGNGNVSAIRIVWSTGASLATGGFSATISGDPGTPAANPVGALVIAADADPFGENDDFGVGGSGVVAANGNYGVMNLPDGWYFPISALDSNGDGTIDPDLGDAIGAYGVVLGVDETPDSVEVAGGGAVTGVDFALYDAIAISGSIDYRGEMTGVYPFYVGVFDTTGFDIDNIPEPDFGTQGTWPFAVEYRVNEFDEGIVPGTYYVGAFLDLDFNGTFDAAVDAAGIYGGDTPMPISLGDGEDALHIDILLEDPGVLAAAAPTSWNVDPAVDDSRRDTVAWIRRALSRSEASIPRLRNGSP